MNAIIRARRGDIITIVVAAFFAGALAGMLVSGWWNRDLIAQTIRENTELSRQISDLQEAGR